MNPLIRGLFTTFRESEELTALSDADAFELFAASLAIPDDLLAQAEMTDFLLDTGTIGIDVAVLEVNSHLAWDTADVKELCEDSSKLDVSLHFIQAKQSTSVSSSDILAFGDTVKKFLENETFPGYTRLNALASGLRYIFDNHATSLKSPPAVTLNFVTTAAKAATVDPTVVERSKTVEKQISGLGFIGKTVINLYGADDLHEAWIRKNHANEVEIQLEKQVNLPKMTGVDQAILGVVSVAELLNLIQNDDETLDERVFYDNVRGFKGAENPVNRQIIATLDSTERNLLPVLNNGVTVVARSYSPKPGDAVAISDYQIVNGCQTSHCLYLSKESINAEMASVYVPIRLVITTDEEVATKIIRATNSQTAVQENDLIALTKFQKKLEDFYKLDQPDIKLTYERRSGQFYSKDVTKTRVVTVTDQMRAISAMFLDTPHAAARYANRLYDEVGSSIFRDDDRLLPYLASAFAAYRIENAFRTGLDPSYKPIRYHILMAYKYQVLQSKAAALNSAKIEQQSQLIIESLKKSDQVALFRSAAERVLQAGGGQTPSVDRLKGRPFTQELITAMMEEFA